MWLLLLLLEPLCCSLPGAMCPADCACKVLASSQRVFCLVALTQH